jgi:NADPH2:quinone reductase
LGEGVAGFAIGDKVLLSARDLAQRGGCYADYLVAPADAVHPLPASVDLEEAVCLANYQVAWALLNACGAPAKPDSVLVIGAAGGVGSAIVQLAKGQGMTVIGTVSSPEKAAFARANGADHIIFYRDEDVLARTREITGGKGVGLVLDRNSPPISASSANGARWSPTMPLPACRRRTCWRRCASISASARPSAASPSMSMTTTARAGAPSCAS